MTYICSDVCLFRCKKTGEIGKLFVQMQKNRENRKTCHIQNTGKINVNINYILTIINGNFCLKITFII